MDVSKISRRGVLAGIAGGAGALTLPDLSRATPASKPAAEKRAVRYGAAVRVDRLSADPEYRQAILSNCDEIVPEGDLKWIEVQPNRGEFRFNKADTIAAFARKNRLSMRGHTLVWYAALPYWTDDIRNRAEAERELTRHIETVMSRYRGQIMSWDVVNEPMAERPRDASDLRPSVWTKHLGRDYLSFAFRTAAAVDPKCQLVLNEYDIEYKDRRFALKRDGLLAIARELKERGDPLHAIGLQAHLFGDREIDRDGLQAFLVQIKALGLKVLITELDVVDYWYPLDVAKRDAMVAAKAEEFLSAVKEVITPEVILTWGITDRYTWVPIYFKRPDGSGNRPLPLDEQMKPKLLMQVIEKYRA